MMLYQDSLLKMHRIIPLFFFLISFSVAFAQEGETDDYYNSETEEQVVVQETDNNESFYRQTQINTFDTSFFYQLYYLPQDSISAWKNQKNYAYLKDADAQLKAWRESLLSKPQKKRMNSPSWIGAFFASSFMSILLWTLAAIFVAFILYKLVLNKGLFSGSFSRKNVEQVELTEDELFLKQDFASLAKSFEDKNDLRSAMRYNFLFTLNKLKERGLIDFKIDKTNKKYLAELDAKYKAAFARLAKYYEYAWYGNINFNESEYAAIKTSFQQFNASI